MIILSRIEIVFTCETLHRSFIPIDSTKKCQELLLLNFFLSLHRSRIVNCRTTALIPLVANLTRFLIDLPYDYEIKQKLRTRDLRVPSVANRNVEVRLGEVFLLTSRIHYPMFQEITIVLSNGDLSHQLSLTLRRRRRRR